MLTTLTDYASFPENRSYSQAHFLIGVKDSESRLYRHKTVSESRCYPYHRFSKAERVTIFSRIPS